MSVATISPAKLAELAREGRKIELIDVRTPVEFREVHLEIARNVPLDQLDPKVLMQARNGSSSEPLYVICKVGRTGPAGLREVHQGRLHRRRQRRGRHDGLHRGGLAGRSRQEGHFAGAAGSHCRRIARVAGSDRIVCGPPGFIWLSAFVGAGLVFAGITDTCGMGMLLARMPWNQCGTDKDACCAR